MRRRAEAKQPDLVAMFHAGNPQAPESDNAGAKQRRRLQVVEIAGKREHEIRSSQGELGESPIHRAPRERRRIAQVFHSSNAVRARSVDAAHPGNSDSCPERQFRRGPIDDLAHNLVAWD